MSVLSMSEQTLVRLPKIKVGLMQRKTRELIGVDCHVSERTIRRDIADWVRTPDFEEWLNEAWLNEYQHVDHSEAFRALTMLMGKKITHKVEAKTEVTGRFEGIIHLDVTEDEDDILNKAASILDKRLPRKQEEKTSEREPINIH